MLFTMRFVICLLACSMLGVWVSADENTLSASWKDGKAESTKSYNAQTKMTTVTEKVSNTGKEWFDFNWTTESGMFGGGTIDPGKNESQTWNTTNAVTASSKGTIFISRFDAGPPCGNFIGSSSYNAQSWITNKGGCSAIKAERMQPSQAAETLFGEFSIGDAALLRVESNVIDLTGRGNYVLILSVFNNSDCNAIFIDEDGTECTVGAGASRHFISWATDEDSIEEAPQVYGVIIDLGGGRQRLLSLRGHFWRIAE